MDTYNFLSFMCILFTLIPLSSFSRPDQNANKGIKGEGTSNQLLMYDEASRRVVLNKSTLDKLASLKGPLHVVTAIGDARIGKSTALNVMAAMLTSRDKKGKINAVPSLFNVCQSLETCTKGVWIHTLPLLEGGHLVMLDVEGTDLGGDMITTQFSLLTSVLASDVLVFLKESFPKRTGIFLHELARLKERLSAHADQVPTDQTLYVIIRDPLKPPQDVSLKTYVTQVLADPAFCIDAVEECKLLEKHFPMSQVNVYSMPYVSRRQQQKTFEWALKDKTYLKTISSLSFDLKLRNELSMGSETTGAMIIGIVKTFIQTLVHSEPSVTPPSSDVCEGNAGECVSPSSVNINQGKGAQLETETIINPELTEQTDTMTDGPQNTDKVGSLDVEKIIKSPFETIGPSVYSFVMNNILRMKPNPSIAQRKNTGKEEDDDDDEEAPCSAGEEGCVKAKSGQDTITKWGKAIHEFIDDISDALDDFFSSVLSE